MTSKSEATHKAVQTTLDNVTSNPETGVSGLVFAATNKDGEILTANASGNRGLDTKEPMTLETTFWIASCTKMIAAIAVMQLVEQGKLDLDDHKQLYKLCPELEKVQVLNDEGKLEDKEAEITLRMLLSHVSFIHSTSPVPLLIRAIDCRFRIRIFQHQVERLWPSCGLRRLQRRPDRGPKDASCQPARQ
jgi:CubicO group peptidase (beta-lactamase class C family)